jgi:hypothetical protein
VTMRRGAEAGRDFFISYTQADRAWAEWIAWVLEEDGHSVVIQAWDFVPGSNWVRGMRTGVLEADRTIAVLSDDYLASEYGTSEWEAAWRDDPLGAKRKLLTVRVKPCDRPDFLAAVVSVDLFGIAEAEAQARLRRMVSAVITGRAKPAEPPGFPGQERAMPRQQLFPGAQPRFWDFSEDSGAGSLTPPAPRARMKRFSGPLGDTVLLPGPAGASRAQERQSSALRAARIRQIPDGRDGSPSARRADIAELMAELYASERAAKSVLLRIGFPQHLLPRFTEPLYFWFAAIQGLEQGLGPRNGIPALIATTAEMYPGNPEVQIMQAEWSDTPREIRASTKEMTSEESRQDPIKSVFISYSQRDERYRQRLDISLVQLRRNKLISVWYDRKILPGHEWGQEIDQNLESADVVLSLVSPDFLASDYAYSREMLRALERHRSGSATLVPIILRPCDWQHSPLGSLQALPSQGRPVSRWPNRDQAWLDVVQGLRLLISN